MANVTWNAGTGNWFVAANWSEPNPTPPPPLLHEVPGAGDDAIIPNNGTAGVGFTVVYQGSINSTINTLAGSADGLLSIVNGTLTLVNGGANNQMAVNIAAAGGLNVSAGTLSLSGGAFAGTLGGAGTLLLRGGSYDLNAGLAVNVANIILGVANNGTVSTTDLNTDLTIGTNFTLADLSGNHAVLNLNSNILTLSGNANLDGTINGPGQVRITGDTVLGSSGFGTPNIKGGATLDFRSGSTGIQHRTVHLGDATTEGTLIVRAGALYTADGDAFISSAENINASVINAGVIRVINGADLLVDAGLSNAGTLRVGNGATLSLIGGSDNTLGGRIEGTGRFVVGDGDTFIGSATVTVSEFQMNGGNAGGHLHLTTNLSYGGAFSFANQFDRLFLEGHTFVLSGSGNTMFNNSVEGDNGRLRVTGSLTVGGNLNLGGTTDIIVENAGSVFQQGNLTLSGTLTNNANRTWRIETAGNINNAGAVIVNNGTFSDVAAGLSIVSADFTNNGVIAIAAGAQLAFNDGGHLIHGTVSGGGTLTFGFGATAVLSGAALTVANLTLAGGNGGATLRLENDLTYAGKFSFANQFDQLQLNAQELTLTGAGNSLLGNTITGAGTLRIEGSATIGGNLNLGASSFENAGTVNQNGGYQLGGALHNEAGATYRVITAGTISGGFNPSIVNDGTFLVNGAGTTEVLVSFDNNAALTVAAGAVLRLSGGANIGGTVSGGGKLLFGGANVFIESPALAVAAMETFSGTVFLTGDFTYGGAFSITGNFAVFDLDGHELKLTGSTAFPTGTFRGDLALVDRIDITGSDTNLSQLVFTQWTAGQDIIFLRGTAGADTIVGSSQGDLVAGGSGNDTITGGGGNDTMNGGVGNDRYVNVTAGDVINEAAGNGTHDAVESDVGFSLAAFPTIEDLTLTGSTAIAGDGNNAANAITGNTANNILNGLDGRDTINGGLGADTINGGNGNDLLIGGAGNDRLNGGADADTFRFATTNSGTDTIVGYSIAADRFDLSGGSFSAVVEAGGNTRLTHDGGILIIQGVTGLNLTQWNARVLPPGGQTSADAGTAMGDAVMHTACVSEPAIPTHADFLGA